jgi:hypothetical protein
VCEKAISVVTYVGVARAFIVDASPCRNINIIFAEKVFLQGTWEKQMSDVYERGSGRRRWVRKFAKKNHLYLELPGAVRRYSAIEMKNVPKSGGGLALHIA